ncbi:hypothetical protein PGTUg99_007747 [Puccinia graminis f. sp. tritici]|uniref:Uncharacterized protein n=1 Tax=Puccinia graminis f. sp. tritici TaxID=56615 RepID=A0A5B0SA98_PUCGR|nr:hypothetical protein PGTUg99_007747 [Puccinia graminis f. sp. tritici]
MKFLAVLICFVALLSSRSAMPTLKTKLLTFHTNGKPVNLPSDSILADPILLTTKGAQTQVVEIDGKQVLRALLIRDVPNDVRGFLYIEGLAQDGEVSYAVWLPSVAGYFMRPRGLPSGTVHRFIFDNLKSHQSPVILVNGVMDVGQSTTGITPSEEGRLSTLLQLDTFSESALQ